MKQWIPRKMTLKESEMLLCDVCNREGDPGDKPLNVGDTYSDEPCDLCGSMGERKKNSDAD